MARVREKVSNVALAVDKLQGLAETLISAQTNRQVQLGREKESRMIEAYNYMSSQENAQTLLNAAPQAADAALKVSQISQAAQR